MHQPLVGHVLLDPIDNLDDLVDVLFKLFSFLQTVHGNEFGFLVSQRIQVAVLLLFGRRASVRRLTPLALLFGRFGLLNLCVLLL